MAKDKKIDRRSPITRDVIRRASGGVLRERNMGHSGEILVQARWGDKIYSTKISSDKIRNAFRYALERDAINGIQYEKI